MEPPYQTARNRPYLGRSHIPTGYECGVCGGVPSFQVSMRILESQIVKVASVGFDRFCSKLLRAGTDETRAYGEWRDPYDDEGIDPVFGAVERTRFGAGSERIRQVTRYKRSPHRMRSRSHADGGRSHPLGMLIPRRMNRPKASVSSFYLLTTANDWCPNGDGRMKRVRDCLVRKAVSSHGILYRFSDKVRESMPRVYDRRLRLDSHPVKD